MVPSHRPSSGGAAPASGLSAGSSSASSRRPFESEELGGITRRVGTPVPGAGRPQGLGEDVRQDLAPRRELERLERTLAEDEER